WADDITSYRSHPLEIIQDDWPGYHLDLFTYPEHYHDDIENVYIPHGVIMNRVERLARYVMEDFEDSKIMVLCVLKGGYKFCADLVESIKVLGRSSSRYLETRVEFIRLKSYLNDQSTEDLHIIGSSDLSFLRGKVCVSLLTLYHFNPSEHNYLSPKRALLVYLDVDSYVGFEIPNRFVVGYALDYNEYFRDLNHICVISKSGKMKYKI
uniref:Phosphoribosyl transferase domain containing 1a n=1 Tax=Fundulus heteroclitus TaxID=8078 RepID=A0A3Q2Q6I7_FUNHE